MKWQITYDNDDINQIIDYCVYNFQYYFNKIEHEFTPSDKIDDVKMKNLLDYLKEQKCYELEKITDYSAYLKDEFNQKDQNINTRRYK